MLEWPEIVTRLGDKYEVEELVQLLDLSTEDVAEAFELLIMDKLDELGVS